MLHRLSVLIANGDVPHDWSEHQLADWCKRIAANMVGYTNVSLGHVHSDPAVDCPHSPDPCPDDADCDCCKYGFRTTPCDYCGSTYHGDREAITFWLQAN